MEKIMICLLASIIAGIGNGFAGLSAATVIGPILLTFLDVPAYTAVGIGLASDILASAISAYTYKRNGNIDIKNGLILLFSVLAFTFIGSFISSLMSNTAVATTSVLGSIVMGLKFLIFPGSNSKNSVNNESKKIRILKSVLSGSAIGFYCGFVGAGGGMLVLLVLTTLLGYETKTALGTSLFVMTFTALTGAISHFSLGDMPDMTMLLICVVGTCIFAQIASKIANNLQTKTLNRIAGLILTTISVLVIIFNKFF